MTIEALRYFHLGFMGLLAASFRCSFFNTLIMEEYKETLYYLLSEGRGSVLSVYVCIWHIIRHIFKEKEVDEIVPNPKY